MVPATLNSSMNFLPGADLESGDFFKEVGRVITRIHWRLRKRWQRYWCRNKTYQGETIGFIDDGIGFAELKMLLSRLAAVESYVVVRVILEGYTIREVAGQLGVSTGYVHKTKKQSLKRLEGMLNGQELNTYFERRMPGTKIP